MKVVLKERGKSSANVVLKERDASSAASLFADPNDHQADTKPNGWTSKHMSSYAQGCEDIDNQLSYKTLACKLRSANRTSG